MSIRQWIAPTILGAAVLVSLSGCGTTNASTGGTPATSSGTSGQGHRGNFQPAIDMTLNPATPTAGKPFTLTFSMERPNRSGQGSGANGGNRGNRTGNWTGGQGGNPPGNWTGGQGGNHSGNWTGGQGGASPPQFNATAQITGNSVNQTVNLTSQNRAFDASVTLQKPGTYQVTFTMDMGQRQTTKQFTITVK